MLLPKKEWSIRKFHYFKKINIRSHYNIKLAHSFHWIITTNYHNYSAQSLGTAMLSSELGRCYINEEVKVAVCEWLWVQEPDLYHARIFKSVQEWDVYFSGLGVVMKNHDFSVQWMSYI
jgi:hypothetical protein